MGNRIKEVLSSTCWKKIASEPTGRGENLKTVRLAESVGIRMHGGKSNSAAKHSVRSH